MGSLFIVTKNDDEPGGPGHVCDARAIVSGVRRRSIGCFACCHLAHESRMPALTERCPGRGPEHGLPLDHACGPGGSPWPAPECSAGCVEPRTVVQRYPVALALLCRR